MASPRIRWHERKPFGYFYATWNGYFLHVRAIGDGRWSWSVERGTKILGGGDRELNRKAAQVSAELKAILHNRRRRQHKKTSWF